MAWVAVMTAGTTGKTVVETCAIRVRIVVARKGGAKDKLNLLPRYALLRDIRSGILFNSVGIFYGLCSRPGRWVPMQASVPGSSEYPDQIPKAFPAAKPK